MNPVAIIIRRNLLASRAIAIPSFGTLMVQRVGSGVVDGGVRLASPYKQLVVNDIEAISIIDYVMEGLGVDQTQATLQYNQWIDESIEGEYLIIDNVGAFEIAGSNIELDPEFALLLNLSPDDKIVLRRDGNQVPQARLVPVKESNTFWVIFAIIAALAAASYLVYYFWDDIQKLF